MVSVTLQVAHDKIAVKVLVIVRCGRLQVMCECGYNKILLIISHSNEYDTHLFQCISTIFRNTGQKKYCCYK